MAVVWIPSLMRGLTGGRERVEARGRNVRQLIDDMERHYPGIKERLVADGDIRPGISVVIDGLAARQGLLQPVGDDSEVHFVPAIGGG
jgi:molybdopterin synthase sulfur carrier subunit